MVGCDETIVLCSKHMAVCHETLLFCSKAFVY